MIESELDFLCLAEAKDIFSEKREKLKIMADRLQEMGHKTAAAKTEQLYKDMVDFENKINNDIKHLLPVWTAVEWTERGYCGQDRIEDTVWLFDKTVNDS